MNQKEKLKLFWKITNLVNKKICRGNLRINKIYFFTHVPKRKKDITSGFYDSKSETIHILNGKEEIKRRRTIHQVVVLMHELAHAIELQMSVEYYQKEYDKHKNKNGKLLYEKQKKIDHGKKWEKTCRKIWTIVEEHIKIDIK